MSATAKHSGAVRRYPLVTVLGGGNSAQTMAADLALRGFRIRLCDLPSFRSNIEILLETKQIEKHGSAEGRGPIGVAHLEDVTTDIAGGIRGADVVLIAVPAYAHTAIFEAIAGNLEDGQVVVVVPGNWGAWRLHRMLGERLLRKNVLIAETDVCMHFCRASEPWLGPGKVRVIAESGVVRIAAIPSSDTPRVSEVTRKLYPQLVPALSILETSIGNSNTIVHGPLVLMNAGWIEHTGGNFMIYRDGGTPSVGRVIDAVGRERDEVAKALGISHTPWSPFYEETRRGVWIHDPAETGPPHLHHRYVTEDVPYGLVPLASLGDLLNVSTPICDALIDLFSIANGVDYRSEGLTLEKLGLDGLNIETMRKLFGNGATARSTS